jgi:hypothetical protein
MVQGCTSIFDGCKPLKMGVFRKPRFSKDDVEKAMEGFFNNLQGPRVLDRTCGKQRADRHSDTAVAPAEASLSGRKIHDVN